MKDREDQITTSLSAGQPPASTDMSSPELPGIVAGRFRVLSRLGSGGFGDVYRVIDESAGNEQLALKLLRSSDPRALNHFKREFRSLADIYHRNIVALYELFAHHDRWMFSMEFVDGVDLLRFLDAQPICERDGAVRSCMMQLAEGLVALHQRNLLHRDVKPSNILVTATGRLVLLDFGLVRAFGDDAESTLTFAGTPHYMSPEQAACAELGEPSDWYAVGVMLYQVLTGRLPFQGSSVEVLRRKQIERPVAPVEIASDVPADLNELCLKLLERDPRKRGSYVDVARLVQPAGTVQVSQPPSATFVGRDELLRLLLDAYAAAEDRQVVVHLSGPSGIGKTVLLHQFIRAVGEKPTSLVFAGRCYEGESVPYQALDDLIDHVAQHLRGLPRHRMEQLLPRNFGVLVKMFPVLAPFLSDDVRTAVTLDFVELRTRALGALREMFGRFSERQRVVLVIDDLQWGDVDGCAALNDLLSSSDLPAILVVLAYRSEDIDASPSLKALRNTVEQPYIRKAIFIEVDHLGSGQARELALSMLSRPVNEATLQGVVEQSAGNPFLVHEIVRWINTRGVSPVLAQPFSLADVVRSRGNDLSEESRHLLQRGCPLVRRK